MNIAMRVDFRYHGALTAEDLVIVDLTNLERDVLCHGLAEWGGPAQCTEALAIAMGFRSVADLHVEGRRMRDSLNTGRPLTWTDWKRVLVATEIVFASDVFGSGIEWSITTGFSDEETLKILRTLQRKILNAGSHDI